MAWIYLLFFYFTFHSFIRRLIHSFNTSSIFLFSFRVFLLLCVSLSCTLSLFGGVSFSPFLKTVSMSITPFLLQRQQLRRGRRRRCVIVILYRRMRTLRRVFFNQYEYKIKIPTSSRQREKHGDRHEPSIFHTLKKTNKRRPTKAETEREKKTRDVKKKTRHRCVGNSLYTQSDPENKTKQKKQYVSWHVVRLAPRARSTLHRAPRAIVLHILLLIT